MSALIIVDLQCDFVPGGALPVPRGDEVVRIANRLQPHFDLVVATRDWHPANHGSFAANHPNNGPWDGIDLNGRPQILWPVHCVQNTGGAEFVAGLDLSCVKRVFFKGTDSKIDSYSGFFDNGHRKATGLGDYLKEQGVADVYVIGLATDYCVKFTALDAVSLGFRTFVIEDACRGIDLQAGDVAQALSEMQKAGITVIESESLLKNRSSASDH